MDLFLTRYASLIEELKDLPLAVYLGDRAFYVSLSIIRDRTIVWDSGYVSLFDRIPRPPLSFLSDSRRFTYRLGGHVMPSGVVPLLSEFWYIRPSLPPGYSNFIRHQGRKRPFIIFLNDNSDIPVFDHNNKLTGYFRHLARSRLVSMRDGSDWTFSRSREHRKGNSNSASLNNGTISFVWGTNVINTLNGVTTQDDLGALTVTEFSRSSVRVNTANFFDLKRWQRPINNYSMQETRYSTRGGYQRVVTLDQNNETTRNWYGPTGFFYSEPAPNLISDSGAESKAYDALLFSIDRNLSRESSQTPTNLVQYRKVVNMVASTAYRLVGAIRAVRRFDFRRAEKLLFAGTKPRYRREGYLSASQSVADNWLELQYGWKPLLNDIRNTVHSLHRDFHPDFRTARGVGMAQSTTDVSINAPFNISLASVSPYSAGKRVTVRTVRVEYGMRYRMSDPDRATLAQLGFLSPVSLAWEIIPFSFVVDWFYPIGPYLESLSAFEGLSFVDGYKSTFVREISGVLVNTDSVQGVFPQRVHITARFGSQRNSVKFVREKLVSFPDRPRLSFKNPISVVHAQNALALLVSNWRKQ